MFCFVLFVFFWLSLYLLYCGCWIEFTHICSKVRVYQTEDQSAMTEQRENYVITNGVSNGIRQACEYPACIPEHQLLFLCKCIQVKCIQVDSNVMLKCSFYGVHTCFVWNVNYKIKSDNLSGQRTVCVFFNSYIVLGAVH